MDKKFHFHLSYLLFAVLGVLLLQSLLSESRQLKVIAFSEFTQMLQAQRFSAVAIDGDQLIGTLKQPEGKVERMLAQRVDPALVAQLSAQNVKFYALKQSTWMRSLLSWLAPLLLFYLLSMFLFRGLADRQGFGDGLMAIGKSRAKVYVEADTKVNFADVAGVDEAKAELQEIVEFLKAPQQHGRLGARLPRGVLLVGPPGTGKTLLARAVAGEAGVPFFSINGSEFVEMFVGVGAARVRDLFEQAREKAPAIIFIDELDALGRARGAYPWAGGHDEKEQTLNQLLSEMDGFDPRSGLILLAATNRPEILDPALLRAGRFDRQVLVDRPDRIGRVQILQVHVRRIQLAAGVDLQQIAALTPGFSGADLANLVNEAALRATRRGADSVNLDDFMQAIERIVAGLEKRNRLLNPREREVVAYHELGHAFVALSLKGVETVQKVSIIPRGIGALGYTLQRPTEDRYLLSREELQQKMAVLLGGRAAEQAVFGLSSTGAADDLARASDIARSMVTRYGMVESLGPVAYEEEPQPFLDTPAPAAATRRYSEDSARRIDAAVRELLEAALVQAQALLVQRRAALDAAAQVLLHQETLQERELRELFEVPAPA